MDDAQLIALIAHWRSVASEARAAGSSSKQPSVLRAHAYGMSDGLEMVAKDILRMLGELGENKHKGGEQPLPPA